MRYILLCIVLFSCSVFSQVKISGKVTDENGEPVPGANIYLKDTYDGASSKENGEFVFKTTETGEQILAASFIGYKTFEQKINIKKENIEIKITLEEEMTELNTIVISAGSFEASDEKKAVVLKPLDIVTTGTTADIYEALRTLPGTQLIGETEGMFVRGGEASETKSFVDDAPVQKPFFGSLPDVPSRSKFSPMLFKGTIFSTGGYSAQYGQALSSALVLKTQDLPTESGASLSLMAVGTSAALTQRWKNTSAAVEIGYYNLELYQGMVKQRMNYFKNPEAIEGMMILRHKVSETGLIKFYSSYSSGDAGIVYGNLDNPEAPIRIKNFGDNTYLNTSYKDIFGNWNFSTAVSFNMDRNKYDINIDKIKENTYSSTAKMVGTRTISGPTSISIGAEVISNIFDESFNSFQHDINDVLAAGFIESDILISKNIAARIGVRGEYSNFIKEYNIAPRISFAYRLGEYGQFNFAYGNFYQTPAKEFLFETNKLTYEKADHYILNYQYLNDDYTFRVEGYYKEYDKLVKGNTAYRNYGVDYFNPDQVGFNNEGYGFAKGIDIFWRDKSITNVDYWISYSYIDTKRDYKNYPIQATPIFVSPHTLSVVFKFYVEAIATQFGLTYGYAFGRPYYNPNNPDFLSDKTRNYNNLSINLSYLTSIFGNFTVIFASLDNIFGENHVFGYRYSSDGLKREAVMSPVLRQPFIGMFMSFDTRELMF